MTNQDEDAVGKAATAEMTVIAEAVDMGTAVEADGTDDVPSQSLPAHTSGDHGSQWVDAGGLDAGGTTTSSSPFSVDNFTAESAHADAQPSLLGQELEGPPETRSVLGSFAEAQVQAAQQGNNTSQAEQADHGASPAHERVLEDGNGSIFVGSQATPIRATAPSPSDSAQRRFKQFTTKVKKPKVAALLRWPSPSPEETVSMPRHPVRSRRLAAQSLSRIPASKRGEYLVLKRMGHATPISASTATDKFDSLFGGQPKDDEA